MSKDYGTIDLSDGRDCSVESDNDDGCVNIYVSQSIELEINNPNELDKLISALKSARKDVWG